MKIKIEKLLEMVGKALLIVSPRGILPILRNARIEAGHGVLSVQTTDLEHYVSLTAPTGDDAASLPAFTVPCKLLKDVLSILANKHDEVLIEVQKDKVVLTADEKSFEIFTLPAEEFPPFQKIKPAFSTSVLCDHLNLSLCQVEDYQSTDESRYMICGVYLEFGLEHFNVVATDGRRVAIKSLPATPDSHKEPFTLRSDTVSFLRNYLTGADRDAKVLMDFKPSAWVKFDFPIGDIAVEFVSKLRSGTYPNWRQVIPEKGKVECLVDAGEFIESLRAAELLTSYQSNSVRLTLSKNCIELSSSAPDLGAATIKVAVSGIIGIDDSKTFSIAFQPRYLIDAQASIATSARLQFIDELLPMVVTTATDNPDLKAVIMPMKLN